MKNVRTFQGSVASDMESLRGFIAEAMGEIASYIPDRDLQYDIRLIIDELMVNGADHGNAWDGNKRVHLRVDMEPTVMHISVRDEGEGFYYSSKDFSCTTESCCGRGLFIVESICRSVEYHGNMIRCLMDLAK